MGAPYDIDDTIRLGTPYDINAKVRLGVPYDIDDTIWLGAPYDIGDVVSTDYFFSTKNCQNQWNEITFLFLNQNLFSYINIVVFFQILVLIFTDIYGKSLKRKKWWRTQRYKMSQYVSSLV